MIPGFMPFYVLFLRKIPSDKGDSVLASAFQSLYLINSTILIRLHALFSSSNCWPTCSLAGVDCSCLSELPLPVKRDLIRVGVPRYVFAQFFYDCILFYDVSDVVL